MDSASGHGRAKIDNLKKSTADFLRGWGGPAPFSQISKQLSCSPEHRPDGGCRHDWRRHSPREQTRHDLFAAHWRNGHLLTVLIAAPGKVLIPLKKISRLLIYKRTHPGDPDDNGWFGAQDCMGRVRWWEFDAVIGVGGIGGEPRYHSIDGKINWIGVGAHKDEVRDRGPLVRFDHFIDYRKGGPDFRQSARTWQRAFTTRTSIKF